MFRLLAFKNKYLQIIFTKQRISPSVSRSVHFPCILLKGLLYLNAGFTVLNSIQGINLKTNSFYSVYQCRKSQSCRFYVQFRWNLALCLEVRDQIWAQILFSIPWTPQLVQPLLWIFTQQSSARISNPLHRVGEWENAERKSGTFSEIQILFLRLVN